MSGYDRSNPRTWPIEEFVQKLREYISSDPDCGIRVSEDGERIHFLDNCKFGFEDEDGNILNVEEVREKKRKEVQD